MGRSKSARLIVHRSGQRGVVRHRIRDNWVYTKYTTSKNYRTLLDRYLTIKHLDRVKFHIPELIGNNESDSLATFHALQGVQLSELTPFREGFESVYYKVGVALRSLHDAYAPGLPVYSHDDERGRLCRRLKMLAVFKPDFAELVGEHQKSVIESLNKPHGAHTLIHGDVYDKQIFAMTDGCVGILDFDTLARGEPELDLANILIHIELRAIQNAWAPKELKRAVNALLRGYGRMDEDRLQAYADARRLHQAMLRVMWPRYEQDASYSLLKRVGSPCIA